ncbi:uncharacterized protein MEPE_06640 [Melanopsichium pennsylvanicum]|uniref:Uncharacterized protein n=1 Tax=Melanopsichium pennsylvanicum TaxID=63383 RepID=A0AAJ5C8T8_9BASI|nr:uncharacterized protein MEPE_06640 [Melanopsichium pennsylvanicum]
MYITSSTLKSDRNVRRASITNLFQHTPAAMQSLERQTKHNMSTPSNLIQSASISNFSLSILNNPYCISSTPFNTVPSEIVSVRSARLLRAWTSPRDLFGVSAMVDEVKTKAGGVMRSTSLRLKRIFSPHSSKALYNHSATATSTSSSQVNQGIKVHVEQFHSICDPASASDSSFTSTTNCCSIYEALSFSPRSWGLNSTITTTTTSVSPTHSGASHSSLSSTDQLRSTNKAFSRSSTFKSGRKHQQRESNESNNKDNNHDDDENSHLTNLTNLNLATFTTRSRDAHWVIRNGSGEHEVGSPLASHFSDYDDSDNEEDEEDQVAYVSSLYHHQSAQSFPWTRSANNFNLLYHVDDDHSGRRRRRSQTLASQQNSPQFADLVPSITISPPETEIKKSKMGEIKRLPHKYTIRRKPPPAFIEPINVTPNSPCLQNFQKYRYDSSKRN